MGKGVEMCYSAVGGLYSHTGQALTLRLARVRSLLAP